MERTPASAEGSSPAPSIVEMVDALLLFDEPALNHRFLNVVLRAPSPLASRLPRVPYLVSEAERAVRDAAIQWQHMGSRAPTEDFLEQSERLLLDGFLSLTESQIRVLTFVARHAPTRDIRALFDRGIAKEREVAELLREAIPTIAEPKPAQVGLRSVQEERAGASFRLQVERAIRAAREAGRAPRILLVSHTGVRHLRDEAAFEEGRTDVLGVPVVVDWGWEASAFALQTFSSTPLEELVLDGKLRIAKPGE